MNTSSSCCDPKAMAVALARWCVGMILLVSGIGKFSMGVGSFAQMLIPMYEKTWLPASLVAAYGHAIPFLEVVLGAFLILGLCRNVTLFVAGAFFITLTFGQIVLAMAGKMESIAVVFQNMVYTFFAAGLLFLNDYDRWTLPCRCKPGTRPEE
jgi:thiosulfate dehydrogenase (quinone) large subunit